MASHTAAHRVSSWATTDEDGKKGAAAIINIAHVPAYPVPDGSPAKLVCHSKCGCVILANGNWRTLQGRKNDLALAASLQG